MLPWIIVGIVVSGAVAIAAKYGNSGERHPSSWVAGARLALSELSTAAKGLVPAPPGMTWVVAPYADNGFSGDVLGLRTPDGAVHALPPDPMLAKNMTVTWTASAVMEVL